MGVKYFIIGLFCLLLVPIVSASTEKVTYQGASVLRTDDNITSFIYKLYCDYPECHNMQSNCTYYNYSRNLDLNCHIFFNNTEPIYWDNAIINFNTQSNLLNRSEGTIIYDNNSIIYFNMMTFANSYNSTGLNIMFNMPMQYSIGSCNENITKSTPNTKLIYNLYSKTNLVFNNTNFQTIYINDTGNITNVFDKNPSNNFFCESSFYGVNWFNNIPTGIGHSGFGLLGGTSSYIRNLYDSYSYAKGSSSSTWGGTFAVENSDRVSFNHGDYCFIPLAGLIGNTTFTNGNFVCNNMQFAFGSNGQINFIDSYATSYDAGGYLASLNSNVYYTIKNTLTGNNGEEVEAVYNITDSQNNKYSGQGSQIDETILWRNYRYTDAGGFVQTEYMPLTINITNSSYINIYNHIWNMTTNNKGIMPIVNNTICSYLSDNQVCSSTESVIGWDDDNTSNCIGWDCNNDLSVGWAE